MYAPYASFFCLRLEHVLEQRACEHGELRTPPACVQDSLLLNTWSSQLTLDGFRAFPNPCSTRLGGTTLRIPSLLEMVGILITKACRTCHPSFPTLYLD